ncbi:MAG: MarR family transcriptional regulator [Armatimonadetes bacterium]|nr:MarR family transcriptional regulator [Armatimonadota bacterium]
MPLSQSKKNAWVAFLVSNLVLQRKIDDALRRAGVAPLEMYDLLLSLEEAPDHRLRMRELGETVLLTPSGITRLVDRAEKLGYVKREGCPNDRRSLFTVLQPEGIKARKEAWKVYEQLIDEHFASKLSDDEAEKISSSLSRLADDKALIGFQA